MYDKIKKWYSMGLWSDAMIANAVKKGVLTQAQADEITDDHTNA